MPEAPAALSGCEQPLRAQGLPLNDLVVHHRTVHHYDLLRDPDVHRNKAQGEEGQGGQTVSSRAIQRKGYRVTWGVTMILVFEGKTIRLVQPAGSPDPVKELE